MGTFSNYLENKILDHLLKNTAYTPPSAIYIGLSTADPLDDGSGMAEPSGKGYARVEIPNWDTASSRGTQNEELFTFPETRGSWGDLTHFALFDALTSGNMLAHGALTTTRSPVNGDSIFFKPGTVDVIIPAGGLSTVYANKILDHIFGNTTLTQLSNIFVALATAVILDSDTGSTITEPADGYARVAHITWDAAASGASENTGTITFVNATSDWTDPTHFALVDAGTAGDIILHAALDATVIIGNGDNAHWADGTLDITLG